jgi:hypothetical protein
VARFLLVAVRVCSAVIALALVLMLAIGKNSPDTKLKNKHAGLQPAKTQRHHAHGQQHDRPSLNAADYG